MKREGLIVRAARPKDGRAKLITLTPKRSEANRSRRAYSGRARRLPRSSPDFARIGYPTIVNAVLICFSARNVS